MKAIDLHKHIKWLSVSDWHSDTRVGLAEIDEKRPVILEMENALGDKCGPLIKGEVKNPPYKPTKHVYGKVFLLEHKYSHDESAIKVLELTDESKSIETKYYNG